MIDLLRRITVAVRNHSTATICGMDWPHRSGENHLCVMPPHRYGTAHQCWCGFPGVPEYRHCPDEDALIAAVRHLRHDAP